MGRWIDVTAGLFDTNQPAYVNPVFGQIAAFGATALSDARG
ncbi:MAG TPA: hypothetical protein VFX12_10870 [Vicinamibacterales bacterium]|nr:hypothetical protein [Vicinamibacterales bacterium]